MPDIITYMNAPKKFIATIAIATAGLTAGATASNAAVNSRHCGKGIAEVPASWGWQFADHAPVMTPKGAVSVWTNRHGVVVGFAAWEDTNIWPSANCAARDL